MKIKDELVGLLDAFNAADLAYAICGGFAVALHGHPRLTRDIDLLVPEAELDPILKEAGKMGFSVKAEPMTFHKGTPSEQIVHRVTKFEGSDFLTLDLVLVTPFLNDVWEQRMMFEMDGRRICAVDREGLIKMKRSAARPQDLSDIENLKLNE